MMILRYCMKLANFRAGFRVVKPFNGAAICTSCLSFTNFCPGVLRCFKATFPLQAASKEVALCFSSSSFVLRGGRTLDPEDKMDSHISNRMSKYADDDDNFDDSLDEIIRKENARLRAMKKARASREFVRSEPEKRILSWNTIEQIKYLRQEDPTEWSIPELAKCFNVSNEVIVNVLKSKFTPNKKVKQKQDRVAANNMGIQLNTVKSKSLIEVGRQSDPDIQQDKKSYFHHNNETPRTSEVKLQGDRSFQYNLPLSRDFQKKIRSRKQKQKQQHKNIGGKSGHHQEQLKNDQTLQSEKLRQKSQKDGKRECEKTENNNENVVKMKNVIQNNSIPHVHRRGRNFYDEDGEFLFRV